MSNQSTPAQASTGRASTSDGQSPGTAVLIFDWDDRPTLDHAASHPSRSSGEHTGICEDMTSLLKKYCRTNYVLLSIIYETVKTFEAIRTTFTMLRAFSCIRRYHHPIIIQQCRAMTTVAISNQFFQVETSVQDAIAKGKPVVALESTIVAHGMPYPENLELAQEVERILRTKVGDTVPLKVKVLNDVSSCRRLTFDGCNVI
jgi:hypothetical protein